MADRYEEKAHDIVRPWAHPGEPTGIMDLRHWQLVKAIASALRDQDAWPKAVPIAEWQAIADERVLIFVVHPQARFAKTEKELADWQGWCVGYWSGFNKGGWIWNGHIGEITHVAPLPAPPLSGRKPDPSISGEPRG